MKLTKKQMMELLKTMNDNNFQYIWLRDGTPILYHTAGQWYDIKGNIFPDPTAKRAS